MIFHFANNNNNNNNDNNNNNVGDASAAFMKIIKVINND